MIGVYITSYEKPNKSSLPLLKRAINSILNQSDKNYKLYIVLDSYKDKTQIEDIKKMVPEETHIFNVPESYGLINYPNDKIKRWSTGGLNATTYAVNKILSDGYEWVCRLDHDDWWDKDHIRIMNETIRNISDDYVFISTRGKLNNWVLPDINFKNDNYYPIANRIFHSTTCINFKKIPLRYEDPFKNGFNGPGDAWMWIRLNTYMRKQNLKGMYIPIITLYREKEGDIKNGN